MCLVGASRIGAQSGREGLVPRELVSKGGVMRRIVLALLLCVTLSASLITLNIALTEATCTMVLIDKAR